MELARKLTFNQGNITNHVIAANELLLIRNVK